jgi:peptidoglycan/LPS O-acetylase OafA/YrhL
MVFYAYLQNFAMTFEWSVNGPNPYWSLAVEEHFYLFWPVIIYVFDTKKLYQVIYLIIIAAFGLRIIMLLEGYEVFYFTFTRFDSLAVGALLALWETKNIFKKTQAPIFLFALIGISIPTIVIWTYFSGESNLWIQILKYVVVSGAFFAFLGYLLSAGSGNYLNGIFSRNFFTYSGKISYGLYVYHSFAYELANKYLNTGYWLSDWVIAFSMTYIVASLSFYLFESWFLSLKKYFEYKSTVSSVLQ